jgi:hypothetical protein
MARDVKTNEYRTTTRGNVNTATHAAPRDVA